MFLASFSGKHVVGQTEEFFVLATVTVTVNETLMETPVGVGSLSLKEEDNQKSHTSPCCSCFVLP